MPGSVFSPDTVQQGLTNEPYLSLQEIRLSSSKNNSEIAWSTPHLIPTINISAITFYYCQLKFKKMEATDCLN